MDSFKPTRLIKIGGQESDNPEFLAQLASCLASSDSRTVVVHGGGAAINELEKTVYQRNPVFIHGKRQTDSKTLQLAEMVLCGSTNKRIVRALARNSKLTPLGFSGQDASIILASADPELGHVAQKLVVNAKPILDFCKLGYTPVIAPVVLGTEGEALNANADDVASALALELQIPELIFLTHVHGVCFEGRILPELDSTLAQRLIDSGVISGGMMVKVRAAFEVAQKVGAVVRICNLETLESNGGTLIHRETSLSATQKTKKNRTLAMKSSCLAPLFAKVNLEITHGNGMYLYDSQKQSYLDFSSGIAVNALGHQHPKIIKEITEKASQPLHLSNLFPMTDQELLAQKLTSTSFAHHVFFSNSGTEANEAAIKFALKYHYLKSNQNRKRLIAFSGGFHGRTMGSLALTEKQIYRNPFSSHLYEVDFLSFNEIGQLEDKFSNDVAAVIVEPIQGESGIHVASTEFISKIRALCTLHDIVLIFDEVQCGLMRTGTLWAHEHYGIFPDILTTAKPLGGGLPLGATLISKSISESLEIGDHGSTFGGNPLACSLAKIVFEEVHSLQNNVMLRSLELSHHLEELIQEFPHWIMGFRGRGLMWGIDLRCSANEFVDRARAHGLLVLTAGPKTIRLLPPLICRKEHIEEFGKRMREVLSELSQFHLDSIKIRSANSADTLEIFDLLTTYSNLKKLLPRTMDSISHDLQMFIVAEWNGAVVGCASLKAWTQSVSEIRSLAVNERLKGVGIGTRLIKALLDRAFELNLKEVFALTLCPSFFERHGFQRQSRNRYPFKENSDCRYCTFSNDCNEIAVGIKNTAFLIGNSKEQSRHELV